MSESGKVLSMGAGTIELKLLCIFFMIMWFCEINSCHCSGIEMSIPVIFFIFENYIFKPIYDVVMFPELKISKVATSKVLNDIFAYQLIQEIKHTLYLVLISHEYNI